MQIQPSSSPYQPSRFFETQRLSKLDRLKTLCSLDELTLLFQVDRTLNNRSASPGEKNFVFAELLNRFIRSKELTETQLLRVIDYLTEYFPKEALIPILKTKIIGCIFLFSYRNYKDELDCTIFEDILVQFTHVLHIQDDREGWEKAIVEAIQTISEEHPQFDFDSLLALLQIGVQLIFHSKKENRDIWDAGPRKLITDGIEKRLTFRLAEILPNKTVALAFLQVYIASHQLMVYNPRELEFLLQLMNTCKCSVPSIVNIMHIVLVGIDIHSRIYYSFYHSCLTSLTYTKLVSTNDIEYVLSIIHKEFNHLKVNPETCSKILGAIRDIVINCCSLGSSFTDNDIAHIYDECSAVFRVQADWVDAAYDACRKYYKMLSESRAKNYDCLLLSFHILAKILFKQEPENQAKIYFCISTLAVRLAADISGAHLKSDQPYDPFDHRLIIRLIEESLCCLETNPQHALALQAIIRNPRLSATACISILEMLLESKKNWGLEYLVQALQKFKDPDHDTIHKKLLHSEYLRFCKILLHVNFTFNKQDFGKKHQELIVYLLTRPWTFDTALSLYDSRRLMGLTMPEGVLNHYFGEQRSYILDIIEMYGLPDAVAAKVVPVWMESLVDKILSLRQIKIKSFGFRHPPFLYLKRELLNLLYEFCRLTEALRNDMLIEDKLSLDERYECLYARPQDYLRKLLGFRLYQIQISEPEVFLISNQFILIDEENRLPLLTITHKEDL